jgi:hypothetical protein
VGGSTSGSATIASTRNFQRQRLKATHEAIGIPIAIRTAQTTSASSNVSHMAFHSIIV